MGIGPLPGTRMSAQEFAQLEFHAKGGNAHAQYLLSAALRREGRKDESRLWLARAADGGYGDAICTQATIALRGVDGTRDLVLAERLLRQAIAQGSIAARRILAPLLATGANAAPDWKAAVSLIIDAAIAGEPASVRQLALLLEIAKPDNAISPSRLLGAARANDAFAAFALLRRAEQGRPTASLDELIRWRAALEHRGHPLAREITLPATLPEATYQPLDRADLEALLGTPPGVHHNDAVQISDHPRVKRIDKLLAQEECDYVVGVAAPLLKPSAVTNPETATAIAHPERTSSDAAFSPYEHDLVIYCLNLRLAAAAGLPVANGELLSVLRYEQGQEYRPHCDFFQSRCEPAAQFETAGQRVRTLLVYLNDGYDGGETHFLRSGLKIKGKRGDAILFHNVDDSGAPDLTSLHAGSPVTHGTKWLISKWFRERAYRP
jgi:hypothetical protein